MEIIKKSPILFIGLIIWLLAPVFFIYEFFLRTFIWIVAPKIILDLHLSLESFALISSAYYIDYAIIQIQVRILANKFRVKLIIIFSALIYAGSALLFSHATDRIHFRFFQSSAHGLWFLFFLYFLINCCNLVSATLFWIFFRRLTICWNDGATLLAGARLISFF